MIIVSMVAETFWNWHKVACHLHPPLRRIEPIEYIFLLKSSSFEPLNDECSVHTIERHNTNNHSNKFLLLSNANHLPSLRIKPIHEIENSLFSIDRKIPWTWLLIKQLLENRWKREPRNNFSNKSKLVATHFPFAISPRALF